MREEEEREEKEREQAREEKERERAREEKEREKRRVRELEVNAGFSCLPVGFQ